MDLSIDIGNHKLNIRAGAIIIHDNKLLIHRNINDNYYAIIGGRVKAGESSAKALKREIFEEMGKEIEITGYVSTIENFFEDGGKLYHEIMFVYRADFVEKSDKITVETIKNVEGKDYLIYEWIDLDNIDEEPLKPKVIKDILKHGEFPIHKINNDMINKYYDNTEKKEPCTNVQNFIKIGIKPGKAMDIGCGAGRDTVYLIKNGWNVTAIDRQDVKERIIRNLNEDEIKRFDFQRQEFESLELDKADLIVANFSLSFCNKNKFEEFWDKIKNSILPNGYFVGNFFGVNDEWKELKKNMSFFSKDEVLKLFDGFEIISFEEVDRDGITGQGKMKHWHYFDVIGKKIWLS